MNKSNGPLCAVNSAVVVVHALRCVIIGTDY